MRTAAVLGTGLIGASIGLELTRLGWRTVGWDPNADSIRVAQEIGAIQGVAESEQAAAAEADVVFLAGPLSATLRTLPTLQTDALVTDVAGVKEPVVASAPATLRFVGGHPMAGREHAGPRAASGALFRGAAWVLTSDGASRQDLDALGGLVASMGAVPREMTAADHDRSVAQISHLPHLLAAALLAGVEADERSKLLAAGSFRDLTRVAASDTGWWPEILTANAHHVASAIGRLIDDLDQLRSAAVSGDIDRLQRHLTAARSRRMALAPSLVRVNVVLQDKPGEIAAVGRALESASADVRDLQLRHAPHGGGGVLTLSVRPGEGEPLRAALLAEGFELE